MTDKNEPKLWAELSEQEQDAIDRQTDALIERMRPEIERRALAVGALLGGRVNDLAALLISQGSGFFDRERHHVQPADVVRDPGGGELILAMRTRYEAAAFVAPDDGEGEWTEDEERIVEAVLSHEDDDGELLPREHLAVLCMTARGAIHLTHVDVAGLPRCPTCSVAQATTIPLSADRARRAPGRNQA